MRRILIVISDFVFVLTTLLSAHEIHDLPLSLKCAWFMVLCATALRNIDN